MSDLELKRIAFGRYLGQRILYFGTEGPYRVKAKNNEVLCGTLRVYDLDDLTLDLAYNVVDIERNRRFGDGTETHIFDITIVSVNIWGIIYTFRYPSSARRRRDEIKFHSMSANSVDYLRSKGYFIPNGVDKREWFMFHDSEFL